MKYKPTDQAIADLILIGKLKHNSQSEECCWKRPKASERMTASLNESNAEIKNAAKLGKDGMKR